MPPTPKVEVARPEDLAPAFRLMFQHLAADDREASVANALHLVSQGELERAGILVVRHDRRVVGALVCIPLRGASALFWPPQTEEDPGSPAVADLLLQHAGAWLRQRGVKISQALLTADETHLAEPLLRNGFAHVTRLHYMRHDLGEQPGGSLEPGQPTPALTYLP